MRYLLDTNIFIYWATDFDSLSNDVASMLNEPDAQLYMSSASVMELVIGFNNKSFDTKRWKTSEDMVRSIYEEYFIEILPFKEEHLITFARLRANVANGHKDPFDHILMSTAIAENMTLITRDSNILQYKNVKTLEA